MDLTGIISISGKPGLYKVIAQGKNNIIVESLSDKRRIPAYATDRISALDDISIYTYEGDEPLMNVFKGIFEKQEGKEAPSHKEDLSTLQSYLQEILPDYDEERVYPSDIKKIFQWYNLLLSYGVMKPDEKKEKKSEAKEETKKKAEPKAEKKAPAKKTETKSKSAEEKKPTAKKPAAKKPAAKKPATKKTTKSE